MIKWRYTERLLRGRKVSTVRLGLWRPSSSEVYIHSKGMIVARAKVVGVVHKRVKELSNEDARLDGFKNKNELVRELEKLYGRKLDGEKWVTIVRLELLERLEIPDDETWGGVSPVDIAKLALKHLELNEKEAEILKELVKTGSIRKVAQKFFGAPERRRFIRCLLRRAREELEKKGLLRERKREEET